MLIISRPLGMSERTVLGSAYWGEGGKKENLLSIISNRRGKIRGFGRITQMKDRLLTMTEAILGSTLDCSKPSYKRTRKKRKSEKEKKKKKKKAKSSSLGSSRDSIRARSRV